MEADGETKTKKKGLKNEHGNYPIWMSHRRIKKITQKGKKNKYKVKRAGTGKTFWVFFYYTNIYLICH